MKKTIKKIIRSLFDPTIGEVLMLHSVTRYTEEISSEKRKYSITPDYLEALIKEYHLKGFLFVTLDEVKQIIDRKTKPKKKVVCFTLDDGYVDNFKEAYPIFKQYNCPFAIYISTNYSMLNNGKNDLLSEQQIYELSQEPLCTIGAHSKSHFRLSEQSEVVCYNEIFENKLYLEKIIKKDIIHFSYPYGDYNEQVTAIAKKVGFHTAACAWGGGFRISSNPFLIPRKGVFSNL